MNLVRCFVLALWFDRFSLNFYYESVSDLAQF